MDTLFFCSIMLKSWRRSGAMFPSCRYSKLFSSTLSTSLCEGLWSGVVRSPLRPDYHHSWHNLSRFLRGGTRDPKSKCGCHLSCSEPDSGLGSASCPQPAPGPQLPPATGPLHPLILWCCPGHSGNSFIPSLLILQPKFTGN